MDNLSHAVGAFANSLLRSGSKIKQDRAIAIFRNAEKFYKRKVEDITDEIFNMETERESLLDLSPTDINSLVLSSDFKAEEFFTDDMKLTMKIREAKVKLEEAKARYNYLFSALPADAVTEKP